MLEYEFTPEARVDLLGITSYTVEQWGKKQANRYVDGLIDHIKKLTQTPNIGKSCNHLIEGLQSFPYEQHKIYYSIMNNKLVIIRVLHQNMNEPNHF